jgi:hypothetical protein
MRERELSAGKQGMSSRIGLSIYDSWHPVVQEVAKMKAERERSEKSIEAATTTVRFSGPSKTTSTRRERLATLATRRAHRR